ncbi:MAG TPA: methyltransferase domain-containing protein [Acidimicrobiales bacterium]|nr:methyltransferase domain-containing protein [Acidimicrobiales bacterium]
MGDAPSAGFTAATLPEAYDRWMAPQLFEPWARELLGRVRLRPGQAVLDVATGPGTVARLAAAEVGPEGRVVATDISPAMLAVAEAKPCDPAWAPIDYRHGSATAIDAGDATFDAVVCQQGLQFFDDRALAVTEMRRVARPGGTVAVATWAAEHPLGLFGSMIEALVAGGVDEPFPGAFDVESYRMARCPLGDLLDQAGLQAVVVETLHHDAVWADLGAAVATVQGTPYGPLVAALAPEQQEDVRHLLARRLPAAADGTVSVRTTSHVARARA